MKPTGCFAGLSMRSGAAGSTPPAVFHTSGRTDLGLPSCGAVAGQRGEIFLANGDTYMKSFLLASIALLAMNGIAAAGETLKFRTILHHAEPTDARDVGDVDRHRLLLVRNVGLASFPDGSIGTTSFVSIADAHKESTHWPVTYTNVTVGDGSVLWLLIVSDSTPEPGKLNFKGTVTVQGGKGRFAEAKGDGTVVGQFFNATADSYFDLVINLK
jgi:hypothetical protein